MLEIVGAGNRGVNVRLKRKKWRNLKSRINRLKRDYNGGARNLNEYCNAMTHIVRSVMSLCKAENSRNNTEK